MRKAMELQVEYARRGTAPEGREQRRVARIVETCSDVGVWRGGAHRVAIGRFEDHANGHHRRFASRIGAGEQQRVQPLEGIRLTRGPRAPVITFEYGDRLAEGGLTPQRAQGAGKRQQQHGPQCRDQQHHRRHQTGP